MVQSKSEYLKNARYYSRRGNHANAIAVLETALAEYTADPDILFELGLIASQAGLDDLAAKMYRVLIQIKPDSEEVYNNLANCYFRMGEPVEAGAVLLEALKRNRTVPEIWVSLGNARVLMGQHKRAIDAFVEALGLPGNHTGAYAGIGDALNAMSRLDEAINYYDRAIKLAARPAERNQIRFNRALAMLTAGRIPEAWDEYEVRLTSHLRKVKYKPQFKPLKNDKIAGQTVLVLPEQGIGDEIEMASIFPSLLGLGADLQIATEPRLKPIFERSFPTAEVETFHMDEDAGLREIKIERTSFQKQTRFATPGTSLPRLFRREIEDFPNQGAYLKSDPNRMEEWRERLTARFGREKPIIGFSWRSGKTSGQRKLAYRKLKDYQGILQRTDCVFVNLQYELSDDELDKQTTEAGVSIENFPDLDQWNDLEGVFALICELDLVISDTTMVATVAGALAVPTLRRGLGPFNIGHNPSPFQPSVNNFFGPDQIAEMDRSLDQFITKWRETKNREDLRRFYTDRKPEIIPDRGRYPRGLILP